MSTVHVHVPAGEEDYGGYDVILTKTLSGATIGLGNPPLRSGTDKSGDQLALPEERWQAGFRDGGALSFTIPCEGGSSSTSTSSSSNTNNTTTSSGSSSSTSGSNTAAGSSTSSSSINGGAPYPTSPNLAPTVTAFSTSPVTSTTTSSSTGSGSSGSGSVVGIERAVVGRRMLETQVKVKASDDQLDYFRQGAKRMACSDAVKDWPEKTIPFVLDVQAYFDMVKNHEIVDILAEAARLLNE